MTGKEEEPSHQHLDDATSLHSLRSSALHSPQHALPLSHTPLLPSRVVG